MRIIGVYFDLTDRFPAGPNAGRRNIRANAPPETGAQPGKPGNDAKRRIEGRDKVLIDKVLISVAKRLVASAVRRNTVKRVVREAWRAALRAEAAAGRATARPVLVCLVRLKRKPGFDARPGSGMTRRILREDADKLFAATFLARSRRRPERLEATAPAGVLPGEAQSR